MDSVLPPYGLFKPDFSLLVLDYAHIGPSISSQTFLCTELFLLVYGLTCIDSSPSLLDCLHIGSFLSLQGSAQLESALLVYGLNWLSWTLPIWTWLCC